MSGSFTFTFRGFSRRFTVDRVKKKKYKQLSSPHLRIIAANYEGYFKCISAMIEVLMMRTYKYIYFLDLFRGGVRRESCSAGSS